MKEKLWLLFFGEQLRVATVSTNVCPTSITVGRRKYTECESGLPVHWDLLRSKKGGLIGVCADGMKEMSKAESAHFRGLRYVEFLKRSFNIWFGNRRDGINGNEAGLRLPVFINTDGSIIYVLCINWFFMESPELEQWTSLLIPESRIVIEPPPSAGFTP